MEGYPLVIRHICGLLSSGVVSIQEVRRDLQRNLSIVGRIPTDSGDILLQVLIYAVEALRHTNSDAHELLGCLSFSSASPSTHPAFLRAYDSVCHPGYSATRHGEALKLLVDSSFIDIDEIGFIRLHPLTAELLHIVFLSSLMLIAAHAVCVWDHHATWWESKSAETPEDAVNEFQTILVHCAERFIWYLEVAESSIKTPERVRVPYQHKDMYLTAEARPLQYICQQLVTGVLPYLRVCRDEGLVTSPFFLTILEKRLSRLALPQEATRQRPSLYRPVFEIQEY